MGDLIKKRKKNYTFSFSLLTWWTNTLLYFVLLNVYHPTYRGIN